VSRCLAVETDKVIDDAQNSGAAGELKQPVCLITGELLVVTRAPGGRLLCRPASGHFGVRWD
jgi:hypothetical protein